MGMNWPIIICSYYYRPRRRSSLLHNLTRNFISMKWPIIVCSYYYRPRRRSSLLHNLTRNFISMKWPIIICSDYYRPHRRSSLLHNLTRTVIYMYCTYIYSSAPFLSQAIYIYSMIGISLLLEYNTHIVEFFICICGAITCIPLRTGHLYSKENS